MDVITENQETIIDNSADDATIKDIISNIELLTANFIEKNGIEDMRTTPQQVYMAMLDYIRMNYFIPNKSSLYKYNRGISHNGCITHEYNYYILNSIVDYYIYMCRYYNKVSNIYGFSTMSSVPDSVICSWGKQESQRPDAYRLFKNLSSSYENGLENGAQSGKNPVGYIATLNHRFGWSADNKPQLTVNITRTKQEILSSVDNSLLIENAEKP